MEKMLVNIIDFFIRKKIVFISFLVVLVAVSFMGLSRLNVDTSIYSVFPENENYDAFIQSLDDNKIFNKIIFSIAKPSIDEGLEDQLEYITHRIEHAAAGAVKDLKFNSDSKEEQLLNHIYSAPYYYLYEKDYALIEQKINPDSIRYSLGHIFQQMSSFNSFYFNKVIARDPLGFLWPQLNSLNPSSYSSSVRVQEGLFYNADQSEVLILGSLNVSINSEKENLKLEEHLNSLCEELSANGIAMSYFAPFLISNSNAKQVKKDTHLTLIITTVLVLLLLLLYYRNILISFYFIVPIVFSFFIGLGIIGFLQASISAISIAASAVLLGIVLDYSFHFLTHYSHSGDVKATVRQIAKPMFMGSFTTVGAFAALMFTESKVLNDFGLMALLVLLTAVFVTLVILPVSIELSAFKLKHTQGNKVKALPKFLVKTALLATIAICVYSFFSPPTVSFDSDIRNLMYQLEDLKQKETQFTGLNPGQEKKLIIAVESEDFNAALIANDKLYQKISMDNDLGISQVISVAPYVFSSSLAQEKSADWMKFWAPKKDGFKKDFNFIADSIGFNTSAFIPFFNSLADCTLVIRSTELLQSMSLMDLIQTKEHSTRISTAITVNVDSIKVVKALIDEIEEASVFESSQMAETLLKSVKNDFSYLLIFSCLFVFLSLLLVYGRIELALFSFFPMAVSWIWILYLASLFGLSFNFVNIMLVTIIFGLGDDFSIFVTDGLLKKYRFKSSIIDSYTSAILLSALTTIIGTGVLLFAKHPAIHSVALLSVVGILSIVLVTVVVQPAIFDIFVSNRVSNNKDPLSLRDLFYSGFVYGNFLLGCLLLNILLLFFVFTPLPIVKKRIGFNYLVHKCASYILWVTYNLKVTSSHKSKLDFEHPSIIVSNHNSFVDIILMLQLHPKTILVVKDWVYNSLFFGLFIRYSGYISIRDGVDSNIEIIQQRLAEGYSVVIFPEGTRSPSSNLLRFHKGAFYVAQQLGVAIQPIAISGLDYVLPKGDFIFKPGPVHYQVLDLITPDSDSFNLRLGLFSKEVKARIQLAVNEGRSYINTSKVLGERVIRNYNYKGPILEWYVKIKWRLERNNFQFYDKLIGNRKKIYDFGCGYGYLSYFLHYRNEERCITGVDYDEEKVVIAQCAYDKTQRLTFINSDLQTFECEHFDVAFFNDVLHYLTKDDRNKVLKNTLNKLNEEGIILIRDGFSDSSRSHSNTVVSEWVSTKLMRFNKVENNLEFFSSQEVVDFANFHNLTLEFVHQTNNNSNDLIVLRK